MPLANGSFQIVFADTVVEVEAIGKREDGYARGVAVIRVKAAVVMCYVRVIRGGASWGWK